MHPGEARVATARKTGTRFALETLLGGTVDMGFPKDLDGIGLFFA